MIGGIQQSPAAFRQRDATKLVTGAVVNELAAAMAGFSAGQSPPRQSLGPPFVVTISGKETGSGKYTCSAVDFFGGSTDPAVAVAFGSTIFTNAIFEDVFENNTLWSSATPFKTIAFLRGYHTSGTTTRAVFRGLGLAFEACT